MRRERERREHRGRGEHDGPHGSREHDDDDDDALRDDRRRDPGAVDEREARDAHVHAARCGREAEGRDGSSELRRRHVLVGSEEEVSA